MVDSLLEAKDFSPCYAASGDDRQVVGPLLSLSLPPKTITAVIGDTAEEVSAWLAALAGITDPCAGRVSVLGQDLAHLDKPAWQLMRTKIAYLGKQTRLMSVLSVLDNMVLPALYHKLDSQGALIAKAERLFSEIEFSDMSVMHRLPANIDRHVYGWALIARAFLLNPKVLILDDFFSAYTKDDSDAMLRFIFSRIEQQGMAALVYHPDIQQLMDKCTATVFIGKESILEIKSRNELLQCQNEEVIDLLRKNDIGSYE